MNSAREKLRNMKFTLAPLLRFPHEKTVKRDLKRNIEQLKRLKTDVQSKLSEELQLGKVPKEEIKMWLEDVERIINEAQEIEQGAKHKSLAHAHIKKIKKKMEEQRGFDQSDMVENITVDEQPHIGIRLPTSELVGQQMVKQKILEHIRANGVSTIVVCGMEGVGKTTLMKHINNQLLKERSFDKVVWITVSKKLDLDRLHKDISLALLHERVRSVFSNFTRDEKRNFLLGALRKTKCVLILDDLWEPVPFYDIGIPEDSCKLVITSRTRQVCETMECKMVEVMPLPLRDSLDLFKNNLAREILGDGNLESIIKRVIEECGGLPLALVSIARRMKGVDDMREWRNLLNELKGWMKSVRGIESDIFGRRKHIYNGLKDQRHQNCFLYCSLYPKGFDIRKEELIEHWITEGFMDETDQNLPNKQKSKVSSYNLGYKIIDQLEKSYLLVSDPVGGTVKMHNVIRGMALYITRENPRFMVKAGLKLEELPKEEEWSEDLERVSLMHNSVSRVPPSLSPNCRKLLTLLLSKNPLEEIPGAFFSHMSALTMLDLSDTHIKCLPSSLSNLMNLGAVLLRRCQELRDLPSLKDLRALRKLDLFDTAMQYIPPSISDLQGLRHLDLRTKNLETLNVRLFRNLDFNFFTVHCGPKIMEQVFGARKSGMIAGQFWDLHDFNLNVRHVQDQGLHSYVLQAGPAGPLAFGFFIAQYEFSKYVALRELDKCGNAKDASFNLPEAIEFLKIMECHNLRSLSDLPPLSNATSLRRCEIENCDGLEFVLLFSSVPSLQLQNVEELHLYELKNLCSILKVEKDAPSISRLQSASSLLHLKHLCILNCPKVEKLFSPSWLQQLQHLEEIIIWQCHKMVEIVASKEEESIRESRRNWTDNLKIKFVVLPKLRLLDLRSLPKLTSICTGKLTCDRLQEIRVHKCPGLKRLPLSLPLPPHLKRITVYQKDWWESLAWDAVDTQKVLQPFLRFW